MYGQVEASQHDVSEKLVPATDSFSKPLKPVGDTLNTYSECRILCFVHYCDSDAICT